nr:HNH endonuclease [Kineococcus vitellinus]
MKLTYDRADHVLVKYLGKLQLVDWSVGRKSLPYGVQHLDVAAYFLDEFDGHMYYAFTRGNAIGLRPGDSDQARTLYDITQIMSAGLPFSVYRPCDAMRDGSLMHAGGELWDVPERETLYREHGKDAPYVIAAEAQRLRQARVRRAARAKKSLLVGGPEHESPEFARRAIPKDVKMYVWQRDGGVCQECGSNRDLEYDHIIPVSMGGSNTERNLQLLCEPCNRSKGAQLA